LISKREGLMKKKNTRQDVMNALLEGRETGNYNRLWEMVKSAYYEMEPNVHKRRMLWFKALSEFDENINDNFLGFYKRIISNYRYYETDYYISPDPRMRDKVYVQRGTPDEKESTAHRIRNWR
jgi:hypothetical protein